MAYDTGNEPGPKDEALTKEQAAIKRAEAERKGSTK